MKHAKRWACALASAVAVTVAAPFSAPAALAQQQKAKEVVFVLGNNLFSVPAFVAVENGFWAKRGYAPVEGLTATYSWKDIDQKDETVHHMQFWMKKL